MRTLVILAIILGIVFLFFVAKAEKSLTIMGNEVVPAGLINAPRVLLDKIGNLINLEPNSTNNIISGAKNLISNTIDKISEAIKTPIKEKINSILCPQN